MLPRVRRLLLPEGQLRHDLPDGAEVQRVLDEMPLNPRRIAREWLIFVACLLVSLGIAVAISLHAREAALADAAAWVDATSHGLPAPSFSLLNRAGELPFWKASMVVLFLLYGTVALVRSVIWAVGALRQPAFGAINRSLGKEDQE